MPDSDFPIGEDEPREDGSELLCPVGQARHTLA